MLGCRLHLIERHLGKVLRPSVDLRYRSVDDEPPAIAARQRRLIVGLVDVVGNVGALGPVEFLGGDALPGVECLDDDPATFG